MLANDLAMLKFFRHNWEKTLYKCIIIIIIIINYNYS